MRSLVLSVLVVLAAAACRAQSRGGTLGGASPIEGAAEDAMSGAMLMGPHMAMTPQWPLHPGDSARAESVLVVIRTRLARYRDVAAAEADGYREFLPGVKRQPIYHFTSRRNALAARSDFDPARPTSLIYRRDSTGAFVLLGAMYTAPPRTSFAALDRRIPLSIARWHEHVNWCVPPAGARARWAETRDGAPVFGPKSPIATAAACGRVGGRFVPRLFGWMVHVNAFAVDSAAVWAPPD